MASILMLVGGAFCLVAGIGAFRLPDIYTRIHAASKSATLGVSCLLLAQALYFSDDVSVAARAIFVIIFTFLTAPVAAHVIGRAAHVVGVPLWERTIRDELAGRYDPETHALSSGLQRLARRGPRSPSYLRSDGELVEGAAAKPPEAEKASVKKPTAEKKSSGTTPVARKSPAKKAATKKSASKKSPSKKTPAKKTP